MSHNNDWTPLTRRGLGCTSKIIAIRFYKQDQPLKPNLNVFCCRRPRWYKGHNLRICAYVIILICYLTVVTSFNCSFRCIDRDTRVNNISQSWSYSLYKIVNEWMNEISVSGLRYEFFGKNWLFFALFGQNCFL